MRSKVPLGLPPSLLRRCLRLAPAGNPVSLDSVLPEPPESKAREWGCWRELRLEVVGPEVSGVRVRSLR